MWTCAVIQTELYWHCVQMSKGMQVQASELLKFLFRECSLSRSLSFTLFFLVLTLVLCFLTKLRAPEVINSAAYKPQKYQFYIIKYCTYKTFTKHGYKITASVVSLLVALPRNWSFFQSFFPPASYFFCNSGRPVEHCRLCRQCSLITLKQRGKYLSEIQLELSFLNEVFVLSGPGQNILSLMAVT